MAYPSSNPEQVRRRGATPRRRRARGGEHADHAAAAAAELDRAFDASTTATAALVLEADVNNETTVATASQLLNSVRSLASTGHKALTKDALQQTLEQFNELCTTMVPPEPEPEPEPDAAKRKPKKKKKKAKKAAAATE